MRRASWGNDLVLAEIPAGRLLHLVDFGGLEGMSGAC